MGTLAKKKLAILTYSLGSGGAEKVVSNLLLELQDKYEIVLFLMNNTIFYDIPNNVKVEYLDNSIGEEKSYLKFIKLFSLSKKFAHLSKKHKIDCSLSFMNRPNFINIISKYFGNNSKIIISERTTPTMQHSIGIQGYVNKLLIKILYKKADLVTANSIGNTKDLINNFGIKNVVTINNSFNFEAVVNNSKEDIELFKDKPVFVTVGRLDEGKNHQLLIESFLNIDAYLYIIGDGNLKVFLDYKIKILNLEDRVFLIGLDKNPHKYIAKSDAFIFSSKFEGFPNVLVEAQICNKPIISFDCQSGPREILESNLIYKNSFYEVFDSGILVLNNEVKYFQEAVKYFLKNMNDFKSIDNKQKLMEKYDKKRITFDWIDNIEKLFDNNKILFISYYFPPLKAIGSLRTYYFAKFLNLKGWKISVITTNAYKVLETDTYLKPLENIKKIDILTFDLQMLKNILSNRNLSKNIEVNKIETKKMVLKKILFKLRNSFPLNVLYEGGFLYIIIGIYKGSKTLKSSNIKNIYSTFSPFSNHIIAYFIKLLNKDSYWVADFRDLPFGDNDTDMFFKSFQKYLNKVVIKRADKVTTISEGLKKVLVKYNENVEVLTNGYDDMEISIKENIDKNINNNHFDIVYTGMLYSGQRDASILFKVVKELILENEKYRKIRLVYAGKDSSLWNSWAEKYKLEDNILIKGVISREESIKLQNNASINLLLTWSTKTQKGILTGKLFEYLRASKPIICIINGVEDEEIEYMFRNINCGFVVYENSDETIKNKMIELFDDNLIKYNYDELFKYSYTYLSNKLEGIYDKK